MALTDAGAAVVCYHETIGAVTGASLRRRVAEILTAQGGAAVQACEPPPQKNRITIIKQITVLLRSSVSGILYLEEHHYLFCEQLYKHH